jgi:hypothetical protein
MVAQKKSIAFTTRELAGYLFVLTLLALGIVLASMLARMFQPKGDWHAIAEINQISLDRPLRYYFTMRDDTRVNIWLTWHDGQWRAFDGFTPTVFSQNCPYFWQEVTQRFEDPCSGAKFYADGTHIQEQVYFPRPLATDLIQYRVELRGDQLWVNLDEKIRPAALPTPPG